MLIGISGTSSSGKTEVARYLTFQGFALISIEEKSANSTKNCSINGTINGPTNGTINGAAKDENGSAGVYTSSMDAKAFGSLDELVDHVTFNWRQNFVLNGIDQIDTLLALQKRPFFLHISIDAPIKLRYQRYKLKHQCQISISEFIDNCDADLFGVTNPLVKINEQANIKIINTSNSIKDLFIKLSELNLMDGSRLRPTWDSYFMRLANLAALRSNCMKRRVGCVIVRGNRVVATGYNGTPRHLTNCNQGGCDRCNKGQGSGAALSTCLCLHAEENALLESGRDRINGNDNEGSVLYCNTCPCLTCSIKIVQSGIKEVVYDQSYSMDSQTHKIMNEANINLRQFQPPSEGVFI